VTRSRSARFDADAVPGEHAVVVRILCFLGAGLLVGLAGCSSDGDAPAAGACNTLANDGPLVMAMASTAVAPTPAGGTVTDGTYQLTAATLYSAAALPPSTAHGIFQITGNTMQQVGDVNGTESRYTSTYTTSGSTVSTTDTCPAPKSATHGFTATSTTLRIYDDTPLGKLEQTYTKR